MNNEHLVYYNIGNRCTIEINAIIAIGILDQEINSELFCALTLEGVLADGRRERNRKSEKKN